MNKPLLDRLIGVLYLSIGNTVCVTLWIVAECTDSENVLDDLPDDGMDGY